MRGVSSVLALVLAVSAPAAAQSLADVARREAARRQSIEEPAPVITADALTEAGVLTVGTRGAAPAPEAGDAAAAPGDTPAEAEPDDPRTSESYWRDRIGTARQQLTRARLLLEAVQSRINALTTDFVNRDDPAQRAVIEQNRREALEELDRLTEEIASTQQQILDIEEEARRAGVPPGWLR